MRATLIYTLDFGETRWTAATFNSIQTTRQGGMEKVMCFLTGVWMKLGAMSLRLWARLLNIPLGAIYGLPHRCCQQFRHDWRNKLFTCIYIHMLHRENCSCALAAWVGRWRHAVCVARPWCYLICSVKRKHSNDICQISIAAFILDINLDTHTHINTTCVCHCMCLRSVCGYMLCSWGGVRWHWVVSGIWVLFIRFINKRFRVWYFGFSRRNW